MTAQKFVTDQTDNPQTASAGDVELEQTSAVINRSIDRCRMLLADCRTVLAANSNEPVTGRDEPTG